MCDYCVTKVDCDDHTLVDCYFTLCSLADVKHAGVCFGESDPERQTVSPGWVPIMFASKNGWLYRLETEFYRAFGAAVPRACARTACLSLSRRYPRYLVDNVLSYLVLNPDWEAIPCAPSLRDHDRWTALMFAAAHGHYECVKFLMDMGVSPTAGSYCGMSALTLAAKYDHVDCMRLLLSAGADPDSGLATKLRDDDDDQLFPLLVASFHGNPDAVRLLLSAGADPNVCGVTTRTAAHCAAMHCGPRFRRCLYELVVGGADLGKADEEEDLTPVDYLCYTGNYEHVHACERRLNIVLTSAQTDKFWRKRLAKAQAEARRSETLFI